MPPKAAAGTNKMISTEVVATILAASGTTIGGKHYHVMAALDESKTASAWEHLFRPIKTRAKEISKMMDEGKFGDLTASPAKKKTPAKRGRKTEGDDEDTPRPKKNKTIKNEDDGVGCDADAAGSEVTQ